MNDFKQRSRVNLILENSEQVPFFTDMAATLAAIGVAPREYDWYVSDVQTNKATDGFHESDMWITGAELEKSLCGTPVQFIWGVFSAFSPSVRFDVIAAPYADGNTSFWRPPGVRPQLAGACFEVVCWDSSATIFVGISKMQESRYLQNYSEARPLSSTWPKNKNQICSRIAD